MKNKTSEQENAYLKSENLKLTKENKKLSAKLEKSKGVAVELRKELKKNDVRESSWIKGKGQ